MGCGAYPSATVRIMDIKRFVQDFIRDYKPDPEGIQTPLDVFTWVFAEVYCVSPEKEGCELDPDDPNRNGCAITYSGTGTYPTWWCYDGFLNFFRWCIPYVEEKTTHFQNQVEVWESTAWRTTTRFWIDYKIVDGHLVETKPRITEGMDSDCGCPAPPKVSEIIKCLEKRRPCAKREKNRYVIRFGAFAEEAIPSCNGGRRMLDLEEFENEYDAGIDEMIDELDDDELDDDGRPCGRMFYSFEMRFKKSKREGVRDITFFGTMFDWNRYVVYDEGLTPDDLAAAIAKHVTTKIVKRADAPCGLAH